MILTRADTFVISDGAGTAKVAFSVPAHVPQPCPAGRESYEDDVVSIRPQGAASYRVSIAPPHGAGAVAFSIQTGGLWYGHGFSHRQPFPLNDEEVVNEDFVVNNIQSPIYFTSSGSAIVVDTYEPIAVRFNRAGSGLLEICLKDAGRLELTVLVGANIMAVRDRAVRMMGLPRRIPSLETFAKPIFSTWTQYPCYISQELVLSFAREVRASGFPCNTIEVDEQWERHFGELEFNSDKFPSPAQMVEEIHRMGYNATLWVSPFINKDAANFEELVRRRIVVNRKGARRAAMLRWWHGDAGIVDFTSPHAREWYIGRLRALKDLGFDGFKIDGGDGKYQPDHREADFENPTTPSAFCDAYVGLFAEHFPELAESRTGWRTQSLGIISRQGGKDSHWGLDNGLKAMITLGLDMALMGFAYILPDMIPGRVQTLISTHPLPTDELFVRWTEASAFFPIMQFSYFPWNYASAVVEACRAYAELHQRLGPYIYRAALRAMGEGEMIIAPLFAQFPADERCYRINDEFLLGRDLLVAPVLDEGLTQREVYLPPGCWIDIWSERTLEGGRRIAEHPAPCPGIPLFVRKGGEEESELLDVFADWRAGMERGTVPSGITTATHQAGIDRDLSVTG